MRSAGFLHRQFMRLSKKPYFHLILITKQPQQQADEYSKQQPYYLIK
jgi:hypothetical protein